MVLSTSSPTPGPSGIPDHSRVARALYDHCRENFDIGKVFNQRELLDTNIIPGRDLQSLLGAATFLVSSHLFRIHDVKTTGRSVIGWELVSQERAGNYKDLTPDESLIYQIIDSAGAGGIWTKIIKTKSGVNSKVADKIFKTLEGKNLITAMKSVKFPQRKMYIVAGMTPSEEATGGAWFTDGLLDEEFIEIVADAIETTVADRSWRAIVSPADADTADNPGPGSKRKAPDGGFDIKGKGKAKAVRIDDNQPRSETPEHGVSRSKPKLRQRRVFEPHPAGHEAYPTALVLSDYINKMRISNSVLPQNAIEQLLDVMYYDDRLYKVYRDPRDGETADTKDGLVTMYRSSLNSDQVQAKMKWKARAKDPSDHKSRKAALRQQELEDIGNGGLTEVPCLRCPVLHLCGDTGPVNVQTCGYFEDWFRKMDEADGEQELARDKESQQAGRTAGSAAVADVS